MSSPSTSTAPPPPPLPRIKRKRNRAQLSCDTCRIAKLKCDRKKPICSSCHAHGRKQDECTRNGVPVVIAPPPPTGRRRGCHVPLPPAPPLIPPLLPAPSPAPAPAPAPRDFPAAVAAPATQGTPQTCPSLTPSSPTRTISHPLVVSSPQVSDDVAGLRRYGPLSTTSSPDPWTALANKVRRSLPLWEQMADILQVYWDEVAVCFPWYDVGEMRAKAEALYALPDRDLNSQQGGMLPLLAFLCASAAKVYSISPRTRLLLWGAETSASELATLGRCCFHEGFVQVERNACPMQGCSIVQLQLTAGAALSLLMLAGVLDPCLRAARQSRMDRLGRLSQRAEVVPAGCFALLVYLDWWAAPAQGCHMVDERTFTTSWEDVPDTLLQGGGLEAFAVWKTHLQIARLARRLGEGEHLTYEAVWAVLDVLPPDLRGESIPALFVQSRVHFLLLGMYMPHLPSENMAAAAQEARTLVNIARTAMRAGHLLPRWRALQHALFNAGLVLIVDLVSKGGSKGGRGEAVPCAIELLRDPEREHGVFSAKRLEGYLRQALQIASTGDMASFLATTDDNGVTVAHLLSDPFLYRGAIPHEF